MTRSILCVAIATILVGAPAQAQQSQNRTWCVNEGNTFSLDLKIKGCTALIQSRTEPRMIRAISYNNRGVAWSAKGDHDQAISDFNEAIGLDPKPGPFASAGRQDCCRCPFRCAVARSNSWRRY